MKYQIKPDTHIDIFESYHGLPVDKWKMLNAGKVVELTEKEYKRVADYVTLYKDNKKKETK